MTIGSSSMSSGYCSLDEDLEDCFFTAKTSFFRSAQSKVPAKVTVPHVRMRALPKRSWRGAQGRAAAREGVLPSPLRGLHRCGFFSAFPRRISPFRGDSRRLSAGFFSVG